MYKELDGSIMDVTQITYIVPELEDGQSCFTIISFKNGRGIKTRMSVNQVKENLFPDWEKK